MPRTKGSRNAGYDDQRLALARKVAAALRTDAGIHASLRELAGAAGTSVATLRHYFGDRDGLLRGVMESLRVDAAPYLARSAMPVAGDVRASLLHFLKGLSGAWVRHAVGPMYASTLALGLGNASVGPSFVSHVLEPLLQTGESLLRQHQERGELDVPDVRYAALSLLSPVVLALLHQDSLQGTACRPLNVPAMVELHVETFLRVFAPPPGMRGTRKRG